MKSAAAAVEFEKWEARFEGWRCGLLHGRLSPEEKDAVMTSFRNGETQVLVSTTVIEVGVDVPNANLMLIFNAEGSEGMKTLKEIKKGEQISYNDIPHLSQRLADDVRHGPRGVLWRCLDL